MRFLAVVQISVLTGVLFGAAVLGLYAISEESVPQAGFAATQDAGLAVNKNRKENAAKPRKVRDVNPRPQPKPKADCVCSCGIKQQGSDMSGHVVISEETIDMGPCECCEEPSCNSPEFLADYASDVAPYLPDELWATFQGGCLDGVSVELSRDDPIPGTAALWRCRVTHGDQFHYPEGFPCYLDIGDGEAIFYYVLGSCRPEFFMNFHDGGSCQRLYLQTGCHRTAPMEIVGICDNGDKDVVSGPMGFLPSPFEFTLDYCISADCEDSEGGPPGVPCLGDCDFCEGSLSWSSGTVVITE